jgi:hypothetical protein
MTGSTPDPADSITFAVEPDTSGFPTVVDPAFRAAVNQSKLGGDSTQQYFDALNQTSDFWGDLVSGAITFAPGVDPKGNPVFMASNGNVEMRLAAEFVSDGGKPGDLAGNATVATRDKTLGVSSWTAVAVRIATMPLYLKFTADLFSKLVVPIYRNTARVLTDLASRLQQATRTEAPSIDALAEASQVVEQDSAIVDNVAAEVGEEGLEYMSIEWGSVVLDVAGLAPLMALPMLAEFLGHAMTHALIVQNVTGTDFTWTQTVVHGETAMQPGQNALPGLKHESGADGDVTLSSSAAFQTVNYTDYGSIGYVLQLHPADGSPAATLVVSVPWEGDNTVWVGTAGDPDQAYRQHSVPTGQLATKATFGGYTVTLSLNKLTGKTYDSYYYCSTAIIEEASR